MWLRITGCVGRSASTTRKQTEHASTKFIEKHILPMTSDVSRNRQRLRVRQVATPHFFQQVKGAGSPLWTARREAEAKAIRINQSSFTSTGFELGLKTTCPSGSSCCASQHCPEGCAIKSPRGIAYLTRLCPAPCLFKVLLHS